MTKVINLYGAPGVGKSTTAAGVFSQLKLHDVNAELITEFAKALTWEKRKFTLENQLYIFAKQQHHQWKVNNQVEVMVTDSPLLLTLIYGQGSEAWNKLVKETFGQFDNRNYFILRDKPYNPVGRNQTEEESYLISKAIKSLLDGYHIPYETMKGNWLAINKITNQVLTELGKNHDYCLGNCNEEDLIG